jgi:hypothetical protein
VKELPTVDEHIADLQDDMGVSTDSDTRLETRVIKEYLTF